MTRLKDWESRLSKLIVDSLEQPFKWGQHDCALWVSDAVLAMTGIDPAEHYRGTYSTARGACRRLIQVDGVTSPEGAADKAFGERLPIAFARVGDVVAADMVRLGLTDPTEPTIGLTLGVCYGRDALFVGSDGNSNGLLTLKTLDLDWCYRV